MSFEILRNRFIRRSIALVVLPLIVLSLSWQSTSSTTYQSFISLGLEFADNTSLSKMDNYGEISGQFSRYIRERFNAPEVQSIMAKNLNSGRTNFNPAVAFYKVNLNHLGFLDLEYSTPSKDQAEAFPQAAVNTFKEVVEKEFLSSLTTRSLFNISSDLSDYNYHIQSFTVETESRVLPAVATFGAILVLIFIIPDFKLGRFKI